MKPIKVTVEVTSRFDCPFRKIPPDEVGIWFILCGKNNLKCCPDNDTIGKFIPPRERQPFPDNCPIVKNKYTREDFYEEALSGSNLGAAYQFHLRNGLTEHNYYDLFKHLVREKVNFVKVATDNSYRRGEQFGVRFLVEYKDGHFLTVDFDVPYNPDNSVVENIIAANNLVPELESKIREKIRGIK
jgi:hypothetical protein